MVRPVVGMLLAIAVGACGSSHRANGGSDGGGGTDGAYDAVAAGEAGNDAATEAPSEASPPFDAGVAMAPPTLQYLGGPLLTAPEIVTVTFAGDDATLVGRLQQFGDAITATAWWTATTSEYCVQPAGSPCVGPGKGSGHVVLPGASAAYTDSLRGADSSLRDLLQSSVSSGALPPPGPGTLYVLYTPANTLVELDGLQSCAPSSFASYHDIVALNVPDAGAPVNAAYAVVARCSSTEAATTTSASHEIVEAATDPSPENAPAFQMTDPAWTAFGPEAADVCGAVDTDLTTTDSGFTVQRSWSNASAAAGHDPCVPVPAGAIYFNVAPAAGAEIVSLSVGASITVGVHPFADGPVQPWSVSAVAANGSPLAFAPATFTATAESASSLTVTLASKPATGVSQLYGLVSQSGSTLHVWPMIVQAH